MAVVAGASAAISKKGDKMSLNQNIIQGYLEDLSEEISVITYEKTDSTNTRAKILAEEGAHKRAILVASEQTAGRGRLGRSFSSNKGKGLYLSILIGEDLPIDFATSLTTYMAVIASHVLEDVAGLNPQIKWVNDLYSSGKKLAGILTEGKGKCEGVLSYAIVGIGINLLKQEFPEEVKDIATTVEDECGKDVDINLLTARIVKKFFDNLNLVGTKELAEEYKSRCFLIGCDVTVIKPTANYPATVKDITDRCELIITLPDGNEEILSTGEVSIRPKS